MCRGPVPSGVLILGNVAQYEGALNANPRSGSGLGLALGFIDCSNEQNCEAEAVLKGRAGYSRQDWNW